MTSPEISELFARAREADVEAVAGVKLFRSGRRMRGECPLCGASAGKRADGAFSVDPHAGYWYCFGGCQDGGDVIDLEQKLRGGSLREAAERLAGGPIAVRPRPPTPAVRRENRAPDRRSREIWNQAGDADDCPSAWLYLPARGIDGILALSALQRLRYHQAAPWEFDPRDRRWITVRALVARPETPAGPTGGVHCTYLSKDGRAKAPVQPAKRMWGPQRDVDGRPGGVWLSRPDGPGPLIVGEGIESTLSAMQLIAEERGGPVRGVATLSLEALQGGLRTDQWGRISLDQVEADPERPAFTWPGQDEVLIAVDRDMKPIRRKVRKLGGGTAEAELDSEARARICAGLAVQAWKAAGANAVRVIAPAAGRDFNDELKARVGA